MSCQNHFDELKYYFTENQQRIVLKGWAFLEEKPQADLTILVNGKPVDYKTIKRSDIADKYVEFNLKKELGFEAFVEMDASIPFESLEFKFDDTVGLSYNNKELKNAVGFTDVIYSIDSKTKDSGQTTLVGWAISFYNEPVEFEVQTMKGQKVEATIKRLYRKDAIQAIFGSAHTDEMNMNVGFQITFNEANGKKYTLVMKTKEGSKKVALFDSVNMDSRKMKKLIKAITPKRVVKGLFTLVTKGPSVFKDKVKYTVTQNTGKSRYELFVEQNTLSKEALDAQRKMHFEYEPKISIVVPMYKTPKDFLYEMVESIENQTYQNYELCLGDGSEDDSVEKAIQPLLKKNPKIIYKHLNANTGISGNTNEALKLATGDYIALLDHDDILSPDALYENVKAINQDRDYEALYSDEDKVTSDLKTYFDPSFKPDFNLDYLRSTNYICHFFVAKKSLVDEVGWFRSEYDGSQDHDLILRCTEKAKKVKHIARILYHWRTSPSSTALNPETKMYCFEAGKKAVQSHLDRLGVEAEVELAEILGTYRVHYKIQGNPLISIIIPNKDHIDDLDTCLTSILNVSTYQNFEVIIVENNSSEESTFEYYKQITDPRVKVVTWEKEFNFSAINNYGAKFAKGDYFLLLNNDTQVISPDWLEEMVSNCQRKEVGAVGAKLYYPDDTIQHCGVIIGLGGIANHIAMGDKKGATNYFFRYTVPTDLSACTAACLMVKRSVYEQLNGLEEQLKVAFNDIDFCLRIREANYLIVMDPYVELYHFESKSRGLEDTEEKRKRFENETNYMLTKWAKYFEEGDPYYNPNLVKGIPAFMVKVD